MPDDAAHVRQTGNGSQGEHVLDFVVQLRARDHSHPEHRRAHRVTNIVQFGIARHRKNVSHHGRNVVFAHFVPAKRINSYFF